MIEFKPITCYGGFLPIEDHGLIDDRSTSALVGLISSAMNLTRTKARTSE
jgi:hypothetical protein